MSSNSKIETFSFHIEKDADVIEHIQKLKSERKNASKYVAELIRKDLNTDENIEDKIKRLINEALKDKSINTDFDVGKVKNAIDDLFG